MVREGRLAQQIRTRLDDYPLLSCSPSLETVWRGGSADKSIPISANNQQVGASSSKPSLLAWLQVDIHERQFNKTIAQHIYEFGLLWAFVGCGLSLLSSYSGQSAFASLSILLLGVGTWGLGKLLPKVLAPFWKLWMGLSSLLNAVMTPLLLSVVWVGCVVPVALILKLIKLRVMDGQPDPKQMTYWRTRTPESQNFQRLKRQF